MLAFWSLAGKMNWLFPAVLCLAALTREYFVALIPVYYFFRRGRSRGIDFPTLGRTGLVSLIPLAIFLSLRLLIVPANPDFNYLAHGGEFFRLTLIHWRRTLYSFANIYGAALFVIIIHFPAALRYLRRRPGVAAYIPCWFLFLVLGGADLDRINFIGFPVVVLLAAAGMAAHPRLYRNRFVLAYLAGAHLILMRFFARLGPEPENWRRLWWSSISFMPEEIFRAGLVRFLALLIGFLLLLLGVSLLSRGRENSSLRRD